MRLAADLVASDPITPRPVFCITARVHNDRAVAEEVCEGRFSHTGITVDLGTTPDWHGAQLPSDEEWRIEWTKFYYGLDLSAAYSDTGEPRFLHTWEELVASWIDQAGAGRDDCDVAARRMQNWTYAWSRFASAPGFPGLRDGLDERILTSLGEHVVRVLDDLTEDVARNHRTLELYSLFVVALAFPQLDPRTQLLDFTIAELHRTLQKGFYADGVHRENSTHYHLVVLRSLLGARENARLFDLVLPPDFDALLEQACEFALHCHRPNGRIPALSDADSAAYPEVLQLAASLFDRPDFAYAATAGAEGVAPQRCNVGFESGGYFIQRSGWGDRNAAPAEERWAIFDCGPLGEGGHGHYDALSVEMYGGGSVLVVDPGRYTYSEEGPNLRHWFKGTRAHNTVSVDGLDQTPYRRGRPGKQVAAATFGGRRSVEGLDVVEGHVSSPCYDALHTRRLLFVDREYWIVADELTAPNTHRYDLRWHLGPAAWGRTEITPVGDGSLVRAPGVALALAGAAAVRLEAGWISPRYGVKDPAPVVSARREGTDVGFVSLVAPNTEEAAPPSLTVRRSSAGGVVAEVDRGHAGRDVIAWGDPDRTLTLGEIKCRAAVARLRLTPAGRPVSFAASDLAEIEAPGELGQLRPGPRVTWKALTQGSSR